MAVALWHFGLFSPFDTVFNPRHFDAYLSVDFFFVLSGFVLSYAYARSQYLRVPSYFSEYMVSRLSRIYPMHLLAIILIALFEGYRRYCDCSIAVGMAEPFTAAMHPKYLLTNLSLTHAWGLHKTPTWNGPSWSISAELACYLLFPFLFAGRRFSVRTAIAVLVFLGVIIPVLLVQKYGRMNMTADLGVVRALCGFGVGCILQQNRTVLSAWMRKNAAPTFWQTLALTGLIFVMLPQTNDAPIVLASAFLVLALSLEGGVWVKLLERPRVHHLGVVSYSVYMIHMPVFMMAYAFATRVGWGYYVATFPFVAMLMIMAGVLALASLTYQWVEAPARSGMRTAYRRLVDAQRAYLSKNST